LTALEEGFLTPHNNQRKSASKRAVGQKAVNHAVEATRQNNFLQNLNRELQQHNRELVQILQQALEEYESKNPRISKALYRRIADNAPSILEDFPQGISPFSDVPSRPQNSSSVSSLDSLSSSSSRDRLSDGRKRESRLTDVSNDTQSKRQCMATSLAEGVTRATTLPTEHSTRKAKQRIGMRRGHEIVRPSIMLEASEVFHKTCRLNRHRLHQTSTSLGIQGRH
jgi:hypothetical protein